MNGYMIVGIVVVVIIVLLLATNKKLIETLKNIYKIEELRKRILYTLGLLLVFRLGCFVVIPGINPNALGADSALADQTATPCWVCWTYSREVHSPMPPSSLWV